MANLHDGKRSACLVVGLGVGILLQGCGDAKIDLIENGGGCVAESSPSSVGRCPGDVSACQVGFADLDGTSGDGCEAALQTSSDYLLFKVADGGVAHFAINDYPIDTDIIGGWVAIKGAACTARMTSPCLYDLVALQLQVSGFVFDGISFSDGVFMLPKPLAVSDNGEGLVVPAGSGVIATFFVGGQKRVVSLGTIESGLAVQLTADQKGMTATGSGLQVSFGDCTMDITVAASGRQSDP